jgi:hypothetical protein
MYGDAYQTAQGMRMPAAQMGLGAQQFGMGYGLQGQQAARQAGELGVAGQEASRRAGELGLAAVGQYPSTMMAPLGMYGAIGNVGAQRRAMTQEAINRDMARYQYQATAPQQALSNYLSMITGNYGGTTTQVAPNQSNTLGNLASIAGIIAPFMTGSDIRIKENIVPEGTKWKGLNVYTYNYIGDSTPRRGVMAQEVEGIYPHAVATINGIKHVNYGGI